MRSQVRLCMAITCERHACAFHCRVLTESTLLPLHQTLLPMNNAMAAQRQTTHADALLLMRVHVHSAEHVLRQQRRLKSVDSYTSAQHSLLCRTHTNTPVADFDTCLATMSPLLTVCSHHHRLRHPAASLPHASSCSRRAAAAGSAAGLRRCCRTSHAASL